MKKELNKIIIFIGIVIVAVGNIIESISTYNGVTGSLLLLVGIGGCFIFAKNDTLKNVGYIICAFCGICGLNYLVNIVSGGVVKAGGSIVILVGVLLYYLKVVLAFFGFSAKSNTDFCSENIVASLVKLKEMHSENVLSEEEYNLLKNNALESSVSGKTSLEDFKKWKKLLDQKVITEEEFAALKAKVFGK